MVNRRRAPLTTRRRTAKKANLTPQVKNAVNAIVDRRLEMKQYDVTQTTTQVINNQLSNASISYYCDFADVGLYVNTTAGMNGRVGTEIDIRRILWRGKFLINSSVQPQMRLRFILVRWANNSTNQFNVGKITTNAATTALAYTDIIAPDTPYQILLDRRVEVTPPLAGNYYKTVTIDVRTPANQSRKVQYSDTSSSQTFAGVTKGLLRLYWFEDNGVLTSTTTALTTSVSRTWFKDA